MPLKIRRLLVIYGLAAIAVLGAYSFAAARQLASLRLMADTGASRAFEEAVTAVEDLSATLTKLNFAGDSALGKRLCAQACADAQAAETAISILPFSTQELEKLSGFLGRTGDYTGSLCALADEKLGGDDRGHLADLGAAAADFAESLRFMQAQLHAGGISMDSREQRLQNVADDKEEQHLSALLLDCERDFEAPEAFAYEGKFSPAETRAAGTLTEAESRALAAKAAGVEERELREEYSYEGADGRRCYSAGGLLLGVSNRGLEFASQSRLVGGAELSMDEARERAERFLEKLGYTDLALYAEGGDNIAVFTWAPTQDDVMRPDDALTLSVALDDGSLYAFDATRFRDDPLTLSWNTDEEAAIATLPEGIEVRSGRRLIRRSPGGSSVACWELLCADRDGREARVYVDAKTGRPWAVEL